MDIPDETIGETTAETTRIANSSEYSPGFRVSGSLFFSLGVAPSHSHVLLVMLACLLIPVIIQPNPYNDDCAALSYWPLPCLHLLGINSTLHAAASAWPWPAHPGTGQPAPQQSSKPRSGSQQMSTAVNISGSRHAQFVRWQTLGFGACALDMGLGGMRSGHGLGGINQLAIQPTLQPKH